MDPKDKKRKKQRTRKKETMEDETDNLDETEKKIDYLLKTWLSNVVA